ncbi:MAG: FAD-dependent oxidoreductase [Aaplasma endosymbiont of Hyalomma asiaticum]
MARTAGIAGAGLAGRMLALSLLKDGWKVSLFDRDGKEGKKSCGYTAGGMLSLYSEAESIGDLVVELGYRSTELWPKVLRDMGASSCLKMSGSLIVAHAEDLTDLERKRKMIERRFTGLFNELHITNNVYEFERELSVPYVMHVRGEGCVDSLAFFRCLEDALVYGGVEWYSNTNVISVSGGKIVSADSEYTFDYVFDCRGIGAKHDIPGLRGVRGEAMILHAPHVTIKHVIRMMHPRYSVYVVPRPGKIFLIGASEIESCDFSEVSVRSVLEMLSAVYSLHRGFAEARIKEMLSACRPAFLDNLPRVLWSDRVVRINGLYRYGYLSMPAIIEDVMTVLNGSSARYKTLHFTE